MLAEDTEKMILATINDDCKEIIFNKLGVLDLLNAADASKELNMAACDFFKRKYCNRKYLIGFRNCHG